MLYYCESAVCLFRILHLKVARSKIGKISYRECTNPSSTWDTILTTAIILTILFLLLFVCNSTNMYNEPYVLLVGCNGHLKASGGGGELVTGINVGDQMVAAR